MAKKPTVFTGEKALTVIETMKGEISTMKAEVGDLGIVIPRMEARVAQIGQNIEVCDKKITEEKKAFEKAESVAEKKRHARQLVYAVRTKEYLGESKEIMAANLEKAQEAADDATAIIELTKQKMTDAEIYYRANNQIVIMGKMVSASKKIDSRATQIKDDFGTTTKDFSEYVSKLDGDDIIAEAEKLIKTL